MHRPNPLADPIKKPPYIPSTLFARISFATPKLTLQRKVFSTMSLPTTHLLSALRTTVTEACPDYIGSVTISQALCDAVSLSPRQLVQIRVRRTSDEIWTYVITTPEEHVCCVNGAAAKRVWRGDEVVISAYGLTEWPVKPSIYDTWNGTRFVLGACATEGVTVEMAVGKIHRAQVTKIAFAVGEGVRMDAGWMEEAGLEDGQQVHLVNVDNGQRNVVVIRRADGKKACEVCVGGYEVGDLIIVMAYGQVELSALRNGDVGKMKVCFPDHQITEVQRNQCQSLLHC